MDSVFLGKLCRKESRMCKLCPQHPEFREQLFSVIQPAVVLTEPVRYTEYADLPVNLVEDRFPAGSTGIVFMDRHQCPDDRIHASPGQQVQSPFVIIQNDLFDKCGTLCFFPDIPFKRDVSGFCNTEQIFRGRIIRGMPEQIRIYCRIFVLPK